MVIASALADKASVAYRWDRARRDMERAAGRPDPPQHRLRHAYWEPAVRWIPIAQLFMPLLVGGIAIVTMVIAIARG
jgi:hypothetical protein